MSQLRCLKCCLFQKTTKILLESWIQCWERLGGKGGDWRDGEKDAEDDTDEREADLALTPKDSKDNLQLAYS